MASTASGLLHRGPFTVGFTHDPQDPRASSRKIRKICGREARSGTPSGEHGTGGTLPDVSSSPSSISSSSWRGEAFVRAVRISRRACECSCVRVSVQRGGHGCNVEGRSQGRKRPRGIPAYLEGLLSLHHWRLHESASFRYQEGRTETVRRYGHLFHCAMVINTHTMGPGHVVTCEAE